MKEDLKHRRGRVILSKHLLMQFDGDFLKVIFSNFYPLAINPVHDSAFWGDLEYYFVSPLFDRVEEGSVTPKYEIVIKTNDDKTLEIESVNLKD